MPRPTALAEAIQREKVIAGVARPESFQETEPIYDVCRSPGGWNSNENEPPEELDFSTAREHEELYQTTSEKKMDGKNKRTSSGYFSESNRESDCPWNRSFGSRGKYIIIIIISLSVTLLQ